MKTLNSNATKITAEDEFIALWDIANKVVKNIKTASEKLTPAIGGAESFFVGGSSVDIHWECRFKAADKQLTLTAAAQALAILCNSLASVYNNDNYHVNEHSGQHLVDDGAVIKFSVYKGVM